MIALSPQLIAGGLGFAPTCVARRSSGSVLGLPGAVAVLVPGAVFGEREDIFLVGTVRPYRKAVLQPDSGKHGAT